MTSKMNSETLSYLQEMVNIGAGVAATALSQLLGAAIETSTPKVFSLSGVRAARVLGDPASPVACVKTKLVGDVQGDLLVVIPAEKEFDIVRMALQGNPALGLLDATDVSEVGSIFAEIGNIVIGVYLAAIHEFCRLNIIHSMPRVAVDSGHAILDETVIEHVRKSPEVLVIEGILKIVGRPLALRMFLVPDADSIQVLVDSMDEARKTMAA